MYAEPMITTTLSLRKHTKTHQWIGLSWLIEKFGEESKHIHTINPHWRAGGAVGLTAVHGGASGLTAAHGDRNRGNRGSIPPLPSRSW